MAINKEWHLSHKMPPKATMDQRIAWHLEHQQHCTCAPIPRKVQEAIEQRAAEKEGAHS
jgi:hypothetical protein